MYKTELAETDSPGRNTFIFVPAAAGTSLRFLGRWAGVAPVFEFLAGAQPPTVRASLRIWPNRAKKTLFFLRLRRASPPTLIGLKIPYSFSSPAVGISPAHTVPNKRGASLPRREDRAPLPSASATACHVCPVFLFWSQSGSVFGN
jgi:hypothetical protein